MNAVEFFSQFSFPRLPGDTNSDVTLRITKAALLCLSILVVTGCVAYGVNYCLTELSPCHYPVWLMSVALMGAGLLIDVKLAYYLDSTLTPGKSSGQDESSSSFSEPPPRWVNRYSTKAMSAYRSKIENGMNIQRARAELVTESETRPNFSKVAVQALLAASTTFEQLATAVAQGLQWEHVIGNDLVPEENYPQVQAAFNAAQQYAKYKDAAVVAPIENNQFQFRQLRRSSAD